MTTPARHLFEAPRVRAYRAQDLARLRRRERGLPDDRAHILPFRRPLLASAPTIAQTTSLDGSGGTSGTSCNVSFSSNTTAGNYLLYVLSVYGSNGPTLSGGGWSLVGHWSNGNSTIWVWENVNAAQITAGTGFGAGFAASLAAAVALEIAGAPTSSPRDGSPVSATGTSTSPAGGSFSNANATELILAILAATAPINGILSWSSPTPAGAAIDVSGSVNNGAGTPHETVGLAVIDLTTTSLSSFAPGATLSISEAWVGVTIGILPAAPTSDPMSWYRRDPPVIEEIVEVVTKCQGF